jgi:cytosine/adenosine deaminase-related metal-dependent hydrolase
VGGFLSQANSRALLPDALLMHATRLEERVGLLTDAHGRISALASESALPSGKWERFSGEIWMAAPVLAHAHLDGFDAPAGAFRRAPFAAWIADLLAWRADSKRLMAAASARAACAELAAHGCGLVAAHVSEPGAEGCGEDPEVLAWCEVLEPFPEDAEAAAARWQRAGGERTAGLALHAPYTVDVGLARRIFAAASGPVSVHLGETEEERECLARGSGPLADLLRTRRGMVSETRHASPVHWLAEAGGLRPGTLAVHAGALRGEELRRLAEAGVAVVFCPGTHAWFGRSRPAFAEAGVFPAALGCDSRASNETLDPIREFRLYCAQVPEAGLACAWQALTEGGARALRRADLGRLAPGATARPLRLRDHRAHEALRRHADPAQRASALLRFLAECADPALLGAKIPDPLHA